MALRRLYLALLLVLVMAPGARAQSAKQRDWRLTVALGVGQTFGSADPAGYRHEVRRLDLFAVGIERILTPTLSVELSASFLTFFVPFLDAAARVSWAPLEQRASGSLVLGALHGLRTTNGGLFAIRQVEVGPVIFVTGHRLQFGCRP